MAPPPLGRGPAPRRAPSRPVRRPARTIEVGPLLDAAPTSQPSELGPLLESIESLEVGLRAVETYAQPRPKPALRPESRRVGTRRTREYYPGAEEQAERERASRRVRRPSVRARPASASSDSVRIELPPSRTAAHRADKRGRRSTTSAARLPMTFGSALFASVAYLLAAGLLISAGLL